jgi:hypothetical protein
MGCARFAGALFVKEVIKAMSDKTSWSSFPEIENATELSLYFDKRTQGHDYFYHYTSLKAIEAILSNKSLRISTVKRFNDKKDSDQFGENKDIFFSLCFSSGKSENLSLWYLYSGVRGNGGRIRISKSTIRKILESCDFTLYEYDYCNNTPIGSGIKLQEGVDRKTTFYDMLYGRCDLKSEKCDLKYNTMTNRKIPKIEYEKYQESHVGFYKPLIWYYEKETRLLVELQGDVAKSISPDKSYAIIVQIDEALMKRIHIEFAPEITSLDSVVKSHPKIKEFIYDSSHVRLSEHSGEIEMNLCGKCGYMEEKCKECEYKSNQEKRGK